MSDMVVTLLTFHPEISWLKADAVWNMNCMSTTELTFQPEISLLNADAV